MQHGDAVVACHVHKAMHIQQSAASAAGPTRAVNLGSALSATPAAAALSSAASTAELLSGLLPLPPDSKTARKTESLSVTKP